jgi:ketosteroid isomerase-like protein
MYILYSIRVYSIVLITGAIMISCQRPQKEKDKLIQEIMQVEKDFNDRLSEHGIRDAFLYYADEGAVIMRNNKIIKGKADIASFYDQAAFENIKLTWSPDFVDVSASGDLAYTYGHYQFESVDSTGQKVTSEGIFHTVWKKQPEGDWKFVYD